jgi:dihydrofolate synthase/folylpolyglutamate synthase
VIHITGTNGKGSVAAFLTSIMQRAGHRVHRLTSPHLYDMTERIVIDGQPIERVWLDELIRDIHRYHSGLAFSHTMTTAALCAFALVPADVVIVEVGIGGRLDSTNVVTTTCLSVITSISLDHQALLGPTLEDIAREKSGILRPFVPCVTAPQENSVNRVLARQALAMHSPLWVGGQDWHVESWQKGVRVTDRQGWIGVAPTVALRGTHQSINAATAMMAAHIQTAVSVSQEQIQEGMAHASWPGRLQPLSDEEKQTIGIVTHHDVWLDGAHNEGGYRALAQWITDQGWQDATLPLYVIVGMRPSKKGDALWHFVAPLAAQVWIVESWGDDVGQAACELRAQGGDTSHQSCAVVEWATWSRLQAAINDHPKARWIVCGSLYLVGYVLGLCRLHDSSQRT